MTGNNTVSKYVWRGGRTESLSDSVPEMEPALRVTGHRLSDYGRVESGRVTGQCVRPGVLTRF